MSTRRWLGMSWWNAAMVLIVLVGAVIMAVLERWGVAGVYVVLAAFLAGSAIYARSGRASDLTRLNAAEYLDERDRAIGTQAFAAVGVAALVLAMVVLVLGTVLLEPEGPMFFILWMNPIVLMIVWAVANIVALRRS